MIRLLTLAGRNLTRNLRRTLLTGAAIAFGLTIMVLMITIQEGSYDEMLEAGISSMSGHVVVEHPEYSDEGDEALLVDGVASLTRQIGQAVPDAVVAPRSVVRGLLTSPTGSVGMGLRGVSAVPEARVTYLDEQIVQGEWLDDGDDRGIVIGEAMARRLDVELGERLVFMGENAQGEVTSRLFRLRGVVRTGSAELDGFVGLTTLEPVRELTGMPDSCHQLTVHLDSPRQTPAAHQAIRAVTPDSLQVMTWQEAMPDLIALIRIDRISADVMMLVIGLIVAMGVLNTVLMSVMERIREFGVLLGLGLRPGRVALMVLMEGLILGLVATVVGVALGIAASYPVVLYGIDYAAFMGTDTLEMEGIAMSTVIHGSFGWTRVLVYGVAAVLFTVLSASYPAWYITRLEPVDAMRQA